jgi:hypothetical protein
MPSKNMNIIIYRETFAAVFIGTNLVCHTDAQKQRKYFGNRVLRKIFGLKRDETTGE